MIYQLLSYFVLAAVVICGIPKCDENCTTNTRIVCLNDKDVRKCYAECVAPDGVSINTMKI